MTAPLRAAIKSVHPRDALCCSAWQLYWPTGSREVMSFVVRDPETDISSLPMEAKPLSRQGSLPNGKSASGRSIPPRTYAAQLVVVSIDHLDGGTPPLWGTRT